MKRLLATLVLMAGWMGQAQAEPPKIRVTPGGNTVITVGETTVTVSGDGTLIIKGPAVDLTINSDGPGPKPPVPNPPAPQPPAPDTLGPALRGLWGGLQEPQQVESARALAAAWKFAADVGENPALSKTAGDIVAAFRTKAKTLPRPGALVSIQERIQTEVEALAPDQAKALTPENRGALVALFKKIATILESLANGQ